MPLNATQRRYLRGLTHHLHPIVSLGQHGPSPAVCQELARALDDHELVKVKLAAPDRATKEHWIDALCAATGAEVVQRIGHVVALYRRHPEAPKLALPR